MFDKVAMVIALVSAEATRLDPLLPLAAQHIGGGCSFFVPGAAHAQIDAQTVAVFHKHVCPETQLGFFARPLRARRESGSVIEACVLLLRRWP
jgi:hypothetical protein